MVLGMIEVPPDHLSKMAAKIINNKITSPWHEIR